jgi:cytochrome c peroxidase
MLDRIKPILTPLPELAEHPDHPITDAKVELGRMLYYDPRLSKSHDVSCNTCHDLEKYGIDIRESDGKRDRLSFGHKNQPGERNSPTVYNAALHVAQFWDGRAADVEAQALGPILNPVEMAMVGEPEVLATLSSIPGYVEKFTAAFPEDTGKSITYANIGEAIGAFERKLLTPAPYDAFLTGDMTALNAEQLYGMQLFLDVGCTQCHIGSTLGGTQFQKLGSVKPWPGIEDIGRAKITGSDADKFVFKVPGLRNIAQTAPYMHNGGVDSLAQMVRLMAEHQTARGTLEDREADAIVAFLGSLTGEIPKDYIAKPELPENGPNTPGPDPS